MGGVGFGGRRSKKRRSPRRNPIIEAMENGSETLEEGRAMWIWGRGVLGASESPRERERKADVGRGRAFNGTAVALA